jgi:hypothetical protein
MEQDIEQSNASLSETSSPPRVPRLGWAGILILPIAMMVYLAALPFFALFWLIEWILPLHPAESDPIGDDHPVAGFHPSARESGQ